MQPTAGLFNSWNVVHKEEEIKPEHAIGFHTRRTICFKYLLLGLSEGNARCINSALLFFFFSRSVTNAGQVLRMRRMNPRDWATATFVDNSSHDVSERNSMTITLSIHTNHTPFTVDPPSFWERVGPPTLREINLRATFTSEPSIEKYQARPAHVNTTVYLDVIENPVEYQKLRWNVSEERAGNWRNLFMCVFV